MDKAALDIIIAMKERLKVIRPYLREFIDNMPHIEIEKVQTMAVDIGWRLYYNPEWIKTLKIEELTSVLYHEVFHIAREHFDRNASYIAKEMEINDDIEEEKLPLPGQYISPKLYDLPNHKLAEEYDELLQKKNIDTNIGSKNSVLQGDCGSIADGKERDYEIDDGIVRKVSDADKEIVKKKVAEEIAKNRDCGNIPNNWRYWADSILNSKIPWTKLLMKYFRQAIGSVSGLYDYSFSKLNKRSYCFDVILPGHKSPKIRIVNVIDTSGSIANAELDEAIVEVNGQLKKLHNAEVYAIACDMNVHFARKINSVKDIEIIGRGGTDMRIGLKKALEYKPSIIILFTDCETPWPKERFKVPVIVIAFGDNIANVPNWMKVIKKEK